MEGGQWGLDGQSPGLTNPASILAPPPPSGFPWLGERTQGPPCCVTLGKVTSLSGAPCPILILFPHPPPPLVFQVWSFTAPRVSRLLSSAQPHRPSVLFLFGVHPAMLQPSLRSWGSKHMHLGTHLRPAQRCWIAQTQALADSTEPTAVVQCTAWAAGHSSPKDGTRWGSGESHVCVSTQEAGPITCFSHSA